MMKKVILFLFGFAINIYAQHNKLMEAEFNKKNGEIFIPDIFTDAICSELKPEIRMQDIEKITNLSFRELAKALYHRTYPSFYRVKEYYPYPNPGSAAAKNKSKPYNLLDNPTGIFVEKQDEIIVFVGDTKGRRVGLRSVNFDKDYAWTEYMLKEGLNVVRAKDKGLLYIMYHTNEPDAEPIKIHIVSGAVNAYYDIIRNTGDEWKTMLDSAMCDYIDVVGKYAHLTFPVEDFRKYTPDIEELIGIYDSIVWLEQRFVGLEKYNRMNRNRMFFHISPQEYYMFAMPHRTGYSRRSMPRICDPKQLRTTAIWGPAHEVGHINQMVGFNWVGLTEVSNNIYTMYVQQQFGNQSRLVVDKAKADTSKIWNSCYERGFTEIVAGGVSQMQHSDVFCKLVPFWQLQLYNAEVNGYTDFYADVHEQIRLNRVPKSDSDAQLQFIKLCCDKAKTDFTDFFEKWGMLMATDETIADLSSIPNVVNYSKTLKITQQQVNKLKKYAARYKKPEENIHYIHDEAIASFQHKSAVKEGKIERTNNKITMTDWENVVAYEVYDGNKLVFVSPSNTFDLPEGITAPILHAVPAKGNPVVKEL